MSNQTRNKDAGIPGNGGLYAETERAESTLDDFRFAAADAHDRYMQATEAELGRMIREDFPDVASVTFESREFDEAVPWVQDARDSDGRQVDDETLDAIRNDCMSGFGDRDFGDRVEGKTIEFGPSKGSINADDSPVAHASLPDFGRPNSISQAILESKAEEAGWGTAATAVTQLRDTGRLTDAQVEALTVEDMTSIGETCIGPTSDRFCGALAGMSGQDGNEMSDETRSDFQHRVAAVGDAVTQEMFDIAEDRDFLSGERAAWMTKRDIQEMHTDYTEPMLAQVGLLVAMRQKSADN